MKSKEDLESEFLEYGQEHVFRHWSLLSSQEADEFLDQLREVDLARCLSMEPSPERKSIPAKFLKKAKASTTEPSASVDLSGYRKLGEEILASGSVAAFTVAGGQGTRLGYDGPRHYQVYPLSKNLFQHFTENLLFNSEKGTGDFLIGLS